MNGLKVINLNGQLLIDSRDVADMTDVRHSDLLEKIKGFIKHLTNGNFRSSDFFIESSYVDGKGEIRPCFNLTKKGCEMVANKMTGEKGVIFTAAYVTKFEQMENRIKLQFDINQLSPELQMFQKIFNSVAEQQLEQKKIAAEVNQIKLENAETKQQVQNITEIVALSLREWRKDVNAILNSIAKKLGGQNQYQNVRTESYELLEQRAAANLKIRVINKQKKMALEGVAKSKIRAVSKLDAIDDDKRLLEIYLSVIKEMAIRYQVDIKRIIESDAS